MLQKNPPKLHSKVLIYTCQPPLLVRATGVQQISNDDLSYFLGQGPSTKDWSELLAQDERPADSGLFQTVQHMRAAYKSALDLESAQDLKKYHEQVISDGMEQFEEVETTLSHLYRLPHPSLRNLSYGEALCDRFIPQLGPNAKILEVGCGTGFVARSFLNRLKQTSPEIHRSVQYTMLDLSPALTASQKENCHDHLDKIRFLHGDIHSYNFQQKFDLVISNEMIADLNVSVANVSNLKRRKIVSDAEKLVVQYDFDLQDAPPAYLVNVGAIRFIEKLKNILNTDGVAFISEFGTLKEFPVAVQLGAHREHSIRFADLLKVAEVIGLKAELETVGSLLKYEADYEILSRDSYALLSDVLLPYLGMKRLERLPYNREALALELGDLSERILNLTFYPLMAKKDLLNPYRFYALVLKK